MFLPKVLYEQMPVIYIYAINTTAGKDSKLYECPIYRKPGRTELNYIGSIGTYLILKSPNNRFKSSSLN